ncbi:uncharacterized protein [Primulina huaijiensis]|uniref:uncharacterized protein n=1 Tax=Primulina huaijiensis TaxID=1492673 RepID=UPI003CC7618F
MQFFGETLGAKQVIFEKFWGNSDTNSLSFNTNRFDEEFVIVRIFILGVTTYTLLDSGAAHSFISKTFIKRLNIIPEDMGSGFKFSIPSWDQMVTSSIVKNLELRSVSIRPPSGKSFIFEASWNKQMPHIISCLCTRRLMRRGCQDFLSCVASAHVLDSHKLDGVEVLKDFPSVFPEYVSGIPPDCEVEISIELMSGTVPISKAPYHLDPPR